jgi:Cyclic nucleotide-binding domain
LASDEIGSTGFGSPKGSCWTRTSRQLGQPARIAGVNYLKGPQAVRERNGSIEAEAGLERMDAVAPHPLAELLACPPATGSLLDAAAESLEFKAGVTVFRQFDVCRGLYVVISGQFLRKAVRMDLRLTLGPVRAGDLVELAATLGDGNHTYSLAAQTPGSMLLLPTDALTRAFESYPPLRMQLLEELAREVSRAYLICCLSRTGPSRRRAESAAT